MARYNCRPKDGTSLNSAGDSYTSADTFEDFDFEVEVLDIRVKTNSAVVSYKAVGASSFGDDQRLPTGLHSIDLGEDSVEGVRIKNAVSGSTADYQFTAWR